MEAVNGLMDQQLGVSLIEDYIEKTTHVTLMAEPRKQNQEISSNGIPLA